MKKTVNIWEYKADINAIIANFVYLWKSRLTSLHTNEKSRIEIE